VKRNLAVVRIKSNDTKLMWDALIVIATKEFRMLTQYPYLACTKPNTHTD